MTVTVFPVRNLSADAKALPNNIEAEQAVLGCVLYDNDVFHGIEGIGPESFYEPVHGRIWGAVAQRIAKGLYAEPVSVWQTLRADISLTDMGGLTYLADLVDKAPPASVAKDHAEIIADTYLRREVVRIADEASTAASDHDKTGREAIESAEAALFWLSERGEREGGFAEFSRAADKALEAVRAAFERDGKLTGLSTGLIDLDRKLGGLHPSDLIILAGRPSMGKTALATNIAFHLAREGVPTGFCSLEMSEEQLALRIAADVAGISGDRIRKGEIDANEFRRLHEALAEVRSIPLHIDQTGGLSIAKLCARARRLKRRHGVGLLVVDYLQLVTGSEHSRRGGRVQEVSEITQALKALAKDLNIPVLALSQLSREVEKRDDKRPQLADLRDSGSIEQDADVVAFVYREAYYLQRAEPKVGSPQRLDWEVQLEDCRNKAEVIIGKQRHGPIGTVQLHFNADLTRFGNLAREAEYGRVRTPYGAD